MALLSLYPDIAPYKTGAMDTGDGHTLYWEACGNPDGVPLVFLHGGPGSGIAGWNRQFFDPEKYNIILFDQRGCGQSRPFGSLDNNTTAHLVKDIEQLRSLLGIDSWVVFGGSWGATLALAYADAHADKIQALVMYGIFLCRPLELEAIYHDGGVASQVFPDVFEDYLALLPKEDRADPIQGYKKLFDGPDALRALDMWTRIEKKVADIVVTDAQMEEGMADAAHVKSVALIENHYFLNNGFVDGDALLGRIGAKLAHIPVHIVQGRYDMVCPFKTAWELHKAVPHSVLHVIDTAGHRARHPLMADKLVAIMNDLDVMEAKNVKRAH